MAWDDTQTSGSSILFTDWNAMVTVIDANTAKISFDSTSSTKLGTIEESAEVNTINTDASGVTGADEVTNIMSLTQSEYDAIGTPNASTFYIITDA